MGRYKMRITEYRDTWTYNTHVWNDFRDENMKIHEQHCEVVPSDSLYIRMDDRGNGVIYLNLETEKSIENFMKNKERILNILSGKD